jgi:hypothetical protein
MVTQQCSHAVQVNAGKPRRRGDQASTQCVRLGLPVLPCVLSRLSMCAVEATLSRLAMFVSQELNQAAMPFG